MTYLARVLLALLLIPLVGCQSVKVEGRVIEGTVGLATIVPKTDQQLEAQGIEGATVSLVVPGLAVPATAETNKHGEFKIKVGKKGKTGRGMTVNAQHPGYLPESEQTQFPPNTYRVLIYLEPR